MTKYTKFEAIFRNETLVFTDRDPKFRNRLDARNVAVQRLVDETGHGLDINELTDVCEVKE